MKFKLYGTFNQPGIIKVYKEKSDKLVGTLPKCHYLLIGTLLINVETQYNISS